LSTEIHATALVSPRAELAEGVQIGPYTTIGDHVCIGRDTRIGSHVVIEGHTRIGERNQVFPFAVLGTPPQDLTYRGQDTRVVIGDENIIREYATIHRATTKQEWVTTVGNRNYVMAYAHIAHDCALGDGIILSNVATLGGHISVGDHAILGGQVAVHQFVRIGAYTMVGGKSGVDRDVPPFMMTAGERAKLYGLNRKGLSRQGFSAGAIDGLKRAFKIIWRDHQRFSEGISQVRKEIPTFPELETLLAFLEGSKRGILR
jgi:UDP-N-acetylglucosamine acyltransferase